MINLAHHNPAILKHVRHFIAIVACLSCANIASAQQPPAPVVTADVIRNETQTNFQFSGSLISRYEAVLSAEDDGRITQLLDIGTRSSKGDIIARLDDTLLQQILIENQANSQSQTERIKFLENEVNRLQKLAKNNNAAISLLEKTQSELGVIHSEFVAAQARIAQTEEKIRRMQIAAPFTGVINTVHTEIGEWVSSGDPIAELVDTDTLEIKTHVPADILPYLHVGDRIEVEIGGHFYKTELHTIVPVGDKTSRLFELRLTPYKIIGPPGLPVQVLIPVRTSPNSLLVPEDSLVIRHDSISVFRVEKNMTASRIPVKTGLTTNNGLIEISGPITVGDKVIIRGGERLRHGAPVRLTAPANNSTPSQ